MRNDVSATVAIRRSNRSMRNDVSTAIAIGRSNRSMRNRNACDSAHRKRQNNNWANCSTKYQRATKFYHYEQPFLSAHLKRVSTPGSIRLRVSS